MRARRKSEAGSTVGKKDRDDEVCRYSLKGEDGHCLIKMSRAEARGFYTCVSADLKGALSLKIICSLTGRGFPELLILAYGEPLQAAAVLWQCALISYAKHSIHQSHLNCHSRITGPTRPTVVTAIDPYNIHSLGRRPWHSIVPPSSPRRMGLGICSRLIEWVYSPHR